MKITKKNSPQYRWGEKCTAWHLVNTSALSVIQEIMPGGAKEIKHKHLKSQQFFFILKGKAIFIIDEKEYQINKNEGFHVMPNVVHQIKNELENDLEFIVISQPHSHGDKIIVDNEHSFNTFADNELPINS